MKRLLIFLLLFFVLASYSQVTNTKNLRVANATTQFDENIPIGTQVYNVATGELWVATASVVSTATLTTASGSFDLINEEGSMVYPGAGIALSTGTAWGTSITNNSANWNTSYDWGAVSVMRLNESATGIFIYPHSAISVGNAIFIGERKADPYVVKFGNINDLTSYTRQAITGSGSALGGLESVCYDAINDKLYFSVNQTTTNYFQIVEVDPDDISSYSVHTFNSYSSSHTPPICTDGTFIYAVHGTTTKTILKIAISTWSVSSTNTWTHGEHAHACAINTDRNQFYVTTAGNTEDQYLGVVSTSDLTFSDVNITSYVSPTADDIAFYDDGTTCNVYVGGESSSTPGVMITTTNGNALTGLGIKASYGLFENDGIIYNVSPYGYIQAFSVYDINNISTFQLKWIGPSEAVFIGERSFFTIWGTSTAKLCEFYIPVSSAGTGVSSISAGTLIDVSASTGDVTVNVDLSEATYDGDVTINDYVPWITGGITYRATVEALGKPIFPNGDSYTSDLNNISQSGVYYAYDGSTNKPGTTNGYVFHIQWTGNSGYATQTFVEYNSDVLYIRRKVGGSWQSWTTVGGTGGGDMTKAIYDANEDNVIDVIRGGTGQSGYTTGDILYANSTVTLAKLNAGTSGYVLTSNGAGSAPSWQAAGGGSTTFIGLTDTPGSYSGQAGKYLKVNTGATALEFTDAPGGGGVTSVAAGNGMDFTTITSTGSVTLGTPSSITTSSTNSLTTTSHTHALDLSGRSVSTQYSLTGGGNLGSDRTLNLVGDVASPGNSKYYGTNSGGTRGFYDLPSGGGPDVTVQSLSGTTPSWDMSNGINAKITLSGNTTITLSNVPSGYSGNLTVTNPSSTYTITFTLSGKTVMISPSLASSGKAITMSGGSGVIDVLSWYYDGTYFIVNGTLDYD